MLHDIFFLILGLMLLVGGANYLTDGAVAVAKRFNVSNLMIGLTVVALGSAMPDIVVCVESALEHKPAIAVGEVVGANIFDLLLVVGVMGIVRPWKASEIMRKQDLPILFIASAALWIAGDTVLFDGSHHNIIDRSSGILLLVVFIFYMWFMIQSSRAEDTPTPAAVQPSTTNSNPNAKKNSPGNTNAVNQSKITNTVNQINSAKTTLATNGNEAHSKLGVAATHKLKAEVAALKIEVDSLRGKHWFSWILIVGGLGALVIGGNWVVDGASGLALKAGMSQGMVALTVVAIGNSLPDLVTSVTATVKGASGIAFGNIVGACIINALLNVGLCATITPLGADTIGFVDFLTLVGASLLIWLFTLLPKYKGISRFSGVVLTVLYVAYMVFTIIRG